MLRLLARPLLNMRRSVSKVESQLGAYIAEQLDHEPRRQLARVGGGWGELTTQGQLGKLIKTSDNGQTVTVQFTVNDTMPPLEEQDAIEAAEREILCHPPFEVMIERPGKSTLFVNCMSNDPNANGEEVDEEEDAFTIMSMAISNKEDMDPYILNMDAMEEDFYDGLLLFLEECGINEEFCADMVRLATDMETNTYLKAMADLKSFLE